MSPPLLVARLVLGAWLLVSGLNVFVGVIPVPEGHEPLAIQLMTALVDSRLLHVAMAIQIVAGALILAGLLVPLALCVVMPVLVCTAFWAVILEHAPLAGLLALGAVALDALLMLAFIDTYRAMLHRRALAAGEAWEGRL